MRDDTARLDRRRRQALVHHALREHDVSRGKRLVNGAVVDLALASDAGTCQKWPDRPVVRKVCVQHRRPPGQRSLGVDHDRQRLVVDGDGVGRVARHVAVAGHDDGDRIADEADHVGGDRAMLRGGKRRPHRHGVEELRDLRAGEDRLDAVERLRGSGVDGQDAAVRNVAARECQVLQAGDLDVVDVGAAALDQTRILTPLDALANELRQYRRRRHAVYLSSAWSAAC